MKSVGVMRYSTRTDSEYNSSRKRSTICCSKWFFWSTHNFNLLNALMFWLNLMPLAFRRDYELLLINHEEVVIEEIMLRDALETGGLHPAFEVVQLVDH